MKQPLLPSCTCLLNLDIDSSVVTFQPAAALNPKFSAAASDANDRNKDGAQYWVPSDYQYTPPGASSKQMLVPTLRVDLKTGEEK